MIFKNYKNKQMKKLMILLSVVFLGSCQSEPLFNESQLLGKWKLSEWLDETNDKKIAIDVDFTFEENSRYIANYGRATEKGKYWITRDNLHTVEDGKAEKKVKIEKLTNDSLIFGMNRMGNIEKLILIKDK